jgi:hypothetical protein
MKSGTKSPFSETQNIEDGTISGTEPVISPALCGTPSFPTGVGSTCENKAPNRTAPRADGPMGMKGTTGDQWNLHDFHGIFTCLL